MFISNNFSRSFEQSSWTPALEHCWWDASHRLHCRPMVITKASLNQFRPRHDAGRNPLLRCQSFLISNIERLSFHSWCTKWNIIWKRARHSVQIFCRKNPSLSCQSFWVSTLSVVHSTEDAPIEVSIGKNHFVHQVILFRSSSVRWDKVKRVVKGYLKENEKLDAILKNAISKIKSRHFNENDFEDATGPCPANLSTFIDPMLEKSAMPNGRLLRVRSLSRTFWRQWMMTNSVSLFHLQTSFGWIHRRPHHPNGIRDVQRDGGHSHSNLSSQLGEEGTSWDRCLGVWKTVSQH